MGKGRGEGGGKQIRQIGSGIGGKPPSMANKAPEAQAQTDGGSSNNNDQRTQTYAAAAPTSAVSRSPQVREVVEVSGNRNRNYLAANRKKSTNTHASRKFSNSTTLETALARR